MDSRVHPSIDGFLKRYAVENQKGGRSRTYAVDVTEQRAGLGSHLLLDALRRCVAGADIIGGRARATMP